MTEPAIKPEFENGIIIDSREKKYVKICEHLGDIFDHPFRVEKLEHGADYLIRNEGELAVQRKTMNNFTDDIDELGDTMRDARQHYETTAILLEGGWRTAGGALALRRGGKVVQTITLKAFHNFMLAQQLRGTLRMESTNLRDTCYALAAAHSYLDGEISSSGSLSDPIEVWGFMPGLGPKRVRAIDEHFDHPYHAWRQSPEGLENVEGIGRGTVDAIISWLNREDD